jgi:hypothetical protein
VTATLPPLGPAAEAWDHLPVVEAIAAGSDWPERLPAIWRATVDVRAHHLSHPLPVQGCPGCPVSEACVWCGFPVSVCEDPTGHDRIRREGEASLLEAPEPVGGGRR